VHRRPDREEFKEKTKVNGQYGQGRKGKKPQTRRGSHAERSVAPRKVGKNKTGGERARRNPKKKPENQALGGGNSEKKM